MNKKHTRVRLTLFISDFNRNMPKQAFCIKYFVIVSIFTSLILNTDISLKVNVIDCEVTYNHCCLFKTLMSKMIMYNSSI